MKRLIWLRNEIGRELFMLYEIHRCRKLNRLAKSGAR